MLVYNDTPSQDEDDYFDEICRAKGVLFRNLYLLGFDPDIYVPGIMNADRFNGIMDKRMASVIGPCDRSRKTLDARKADKEKQDFLEYIGYLYQACSMYTDLTDKQIYETYNITDESIYFPGERAAEAIYIRGGGHMSTEEEVRGILGGAAYRSGCGWNDRSMLEKLGVSSQELSDR